MQVNLVDAADVLAPPLFSTGGSAVARYVASLVRHGARAYVDNAHVSVHAVVTGEKILPLVVNEGTEGNAAVCSPSAHYVEYALRELARRHRLVPRVGLETLASSLGALLRRGALDRVVFVNNWLLGTNPCPRLSAVEIAHLTAHLIERYPDAAIVFRSVNPALDPPGVDALRANHYRLVRSRRVYVMDPRTERHRQAENVRTDLRLLRASRYVVAGCHELLLRHVRRLAGLYRDLYLGKHTPLNPQFNERFFQLTLRERVLTYRALVSDGRVDAFCAYFVEDGVMTAVLVGYDHRLPKRLGLYRMAVAVLMAAAAEHGVLLNVGGGAGRFKMLRGAAPVEEYDAVYDHHLPLRRRLAWTALRVGVGRIGRIVAWMRERPPR